MRMGPGLAHVSMLRVLMFPPSRLVAGAGKVKVVRVVDEISLSFSSLFVFVRSFVRSFGGSCLPGSGVL